MANVQCAGCSAQLTNGPLGQLLETHCPAGSGTKQKSRNEVVEKYTLQMGHDRKVEHEHFDVPVGGSGETHRYRSQEQNALESCEARDM